jgi:hypothetical protein
LACIIGGLVALLGLSAAPALASEGGCAVGSLSKPFERFGDTASYGPVPGGSFEEGSGGWALTNAAATAGNESFGVAGGSHSLAIQPNGQAVSPAFCVSTAQPTLRFFARQTSGSWAVLNVILRWRDSSGRSHDTTVGSLQGGTAWKPTPALALGTTLPLWRDGETLSVQLVLKPEAYGGAWAVDDIYVDPRMR